MMTAMDVTEVLLPGVGVRYDFTTRQGERFAVVTRRSGHVEFMAYGDDPDTPVPLWRLDAEEAEVLAELLGAPRIAERFADLTKEIPGLGAGQVPVTGSSPHAGRPLGDTRARTLTGASVVAVVRGDTVVASPRPDEILRAGDVLVVIGTHEGIAGVQSIISG
jgi:TrkA domain protein